MIADVIMPLDREAVRAEFANASPFPHFKIDNFLAPDFAAAVAAAYPTYEAARAIGREFEKVRERLKIQVTDETKFPEPVRKLAAALSSSQWLDHLQYITAIANLVGDPEFVGGGMHISSSGGRLDVHVDFNFVPERQLHRRLNILLYLNPIWERSWGGFIELWDKDVRNCQRSFEPVFNRCVVFETSEISYHGVTPISAPPGYTRQSFAAYYYTREAPPNWDGRQHSTLFKDRPAERMRRYVLIPADAMRRNLRKAISDGKRRIKGLMR